MRASVVVSRRLETERIKELGRRIKS